jgi:hypothetical protein
MNEQGTSESSDKQKENILLVDNCYAQSERITPDIRVRILSNLIFLFDGYITMFLGRLTVLWIVAASAAIAVGTTAVIMISLRSGLYTQVANAETVVATGIIGIAIGIIALATSYYNPQVKTNKKIRRILANVKMTKTDATSSDGVKRDYFLERITANISLVTKDLIILENLLRKYLDNCLANSWQTVRYIAERSRKRIEKLEPEVLLDFAQIVDLIHSPSLIDRSTSHKLYYSLHLCHEILRINPEYDQNLLRDLGNALRLHIAQLDNILLLLERERET